MLLMILIMKKLLEHVMKNQLQKSNQTELRIEEVKRKGNKIYIKWKDYENSFSSWIKRVLYENESKFSKTI